MRERVFDRAREESFGIPGFRRRPKHRAARQTAKPDRLPHHFRRTLSGALAICWLTAAALNAAIWPEHLGRYTRKSVSVPSLSTATDEYGLQAVEAADYGAFKTTAAQYKDSTGAYAASLEHPS